uniref:Putative secreted protein n=1 Tax=Ixodes ricinus TaxID=34613 RepID=A0A6B0UAC3_IXORI
MLASSLLMRLVSASLLLQLRMSEMKTASPLIPSPLAGGIVVHDFKTAERAGGVGDLAARYARVVAVDSARLRGSSGPRSVANHARKLRTDPPAINS